MINVVDEELAAAMNETSGEWAYSDLLRPNGLVDAPRLRPVARLSGDEYATIGRVFEMKRPQ